MISIAIDGPSGAGKSTIARAVAKHFGYVYVDTGAIYRTIGLAAYLCGIDTKDKKGVLSLLPKINIELKYNSEGVQCMLLDGRDVSSEIRQPHISMCAANVSAIPELRAYLIDMQRDMARRHNVVMDGRDIGTVILPNAEAKIFLTASPEARAERRYKELLEKGSETSFAEVLADMKKRDEQDSHRAAAPLVPAEDAVHLDTSRLTLSESIDAACRIVSEKTNAGMKP